MASTKEMGTRAFCRDKRKVRTHENSWKASALHTSNTHHTHIPNVSLTHDSIKRWNMVVLGLGSMVDTGKIIFD